MVAPTALLLVLLLTEQAFLTDSFSPPRVVNGGAVHHRHILHTPSSSDAFQMPRSTPSSRLVASFSVTSGDFAAGGTLLLSSIIGVISEKFSSSGGHVVTLLSAALLSNTLRMVPTDHSLYNLCWSIFLPSSLVFALLSTSTNASSDSSSTASSLKQDSNKTAKVNSSILGMTVPFAAGSIGSIVGCCASFFFIKFHDIKATAILAGCLCASYIGGTVNFFAAAKILIPMFNCNTGGGGISSLFGSLAAADLVVMAMYFSLLSFASKSTLLQSLFPSRDVDYAKKIPISAVINGEGSSKKIETNASVGSSIIAVVLACFVSISAVLAATDLEKKINNVANIPGSMCAFLAIFGLIAERLIRVGLTQMKKESSTRTSHLVRTLEEVAVVSPKLSNICFYLLFASVGTTADISSAIGSGPKALLFASLALLIHCAIVLVGTLVGGRLVRGILPQSTLQEVLTASNAAIGGPSTAAAFAADLVPVTLSSRLNGQLRRSLILGATVWGVFGYAVGTTIGVALTKSLMRWI
mmetsp:Transcript_11064/g.18215  ORF Transcript_11064/g.18215 Transcript_11064/m.18215 type:complete len:526 (+) Transcript_11064:65-1642(+)